MIVILFDSTFTDADPAAKFLCAYMLDLCINFYLHTRDPNVSVTKTKSLVGDNWTPLGKCMLLMSTVFSFVFGLYLTSLPVGPASASSAKSSMPEIVLASEKYMFPFLSTSKSSGNLGRSPSISTSILTSFSEIPVTKLILGKCQCCNKAIIFPHLCNMSSKMKNWIQLGMHHE